MTTGLLRTTTPPPIRLPLCGAALGAAALLAIKLHVFAGPFAPQPTTGSALVELGVEVKDALMSRITGAAPPAPVPVVRTVDDWLWIGSIAAAVMGLFASRVAVALRHAPRVAAAGVLLSGAALASVWLWWLALMLLAMALLACIGDIVGEILGGLGPF